jgi:hypothetical protein
MDVDGIIARHDPDDTLDRTVVRAIVAEALAAAQGAAVPPPPIMEPSWSGFFKRTIPERQQQVGLKRPF